MRPSYDDWAEADETYDRNKICDPAEMRQYKEDKFAGKKTAIDEYTGKRINIKNADVDHVISANEVHARYQGLSDAQQKELANKRYNYAVTEKGINRSKSDTPANLHVKYKALEGNPYDARTSANMIGRQVNSSIRMDIDATGMRARNAATKASSSLSSLFFGKKKK